MSNSKVKIKSKSLPNSRIAIEFEVPAQECKSSFEDSLSNLCNDIKNERMTTYLHNRKEEETKEASDL